MNQKSLIGIVIVLVAALGIVAFLWYQDSQSTHIQMSVGEGGVSIDTR
jgi:hypothetical protein